MLFICVKLYQNIWGGFQLTEQTRGNIRNGYFHYLLCSNGVTKKVGQLKQRFLCTAHLLTVLYICEKFHKKVSQTVFTLQNGHKYMVEIAMFNVQRAITPKVSRLELRFMSSARRLIKL